MSKKLDVWLVLAYNNSHSIEDIIIFDNEREALAEQRQINDNDTDSNLCYATVHHRRLMTEKLNGQES